MKDAREQVAGAEDTFRQVQQNKGLLHLGAQSGMLIESLGSVHAQIAAKVVQLQMLQTFSTEHNPAVQMTEQEIASLQAEAARLEQNNSSSGFSEMGLKDAPKAGLEYLHAQEQLISRQTYVAMIEKQYEAARLDEAKDAAVIQVVEPAIPPEHKSSPHRTSIVLLFMMAGFMLACAYVYLCNFAQRNPELARSLADIGEMVIHR